MVAVRYESAEDFRAIYQVAWEARTKQNLRLE